MMRSLSWFVMGYFIEHLASALLIFKILRQRSVYGISYESQLCLLVATLSRLIWFSDTQLSNLDSAFIELFLAVTLHAVLVYLCRKLRDNQLYCEPPVYLRAWWLLAQAFVLSLFLHPGNKSKNYFFTQQMFVSFTLYAETSALITQLWHLKKTQACEGLNSGYLVMVGISRFTRIFFWKSMSAQASNFWYLIGADVIHTLLTIYFMIRYRSIKKSYS